MSLIKINNLNVSLKENSMPLINGVSFEINENETVALVGASGSGKTLTGYSILRILPKDLESKKGEIIFEGKNILEISDKNMEDVRGRRISMVFQEPFTSLNPVINIGEQMVEAVIYHKNIKRRDALPGVFNILEKVMVKNPKAVFYKYPHQLSGGERQRVMIAMSVMLNPRLLIADEPTTALDVTVQAQVLDVLRKIKEELKMSMLFITHDFGIVNMIADRVLVMNKGMIVDSGTKDKIFKSPENGYTKKLLDAVPKLRRAEASDEIAQNINEVFIELKNVNKTFSVGKGFFKNELFQVRAVNDVNMVIKKGDIVGLVGESGSGKSTLGRIILGLEKHDSGEIILNEELAANKPHRRLREIMQIVFQDPFGSLDPRMRMEEIITEGAPLAGISKDECDKRFKDVIDSVRLLYEERSKFPHQFSGGERQRIAIARALFVNPEFLVLDEPVSSLDVLVQKDILGLLKELQKNFNLTYLLISHDLRVVESMSNIVYVMKDGRIVESGSPEKIYNSPEDGYTKMLINSCPAIID